MANEETTLQFMMQVLDQYSSMAKNMSEAARQTINSFLDVIRDNTGARELKKYLNADKENSAAVYFCKKEHQEKLDKSLTEAGICHVSCKRADMNGNKKYLCLNIGDEDGTTVIAEISKATLSAMQQNKIPMEAVYRQAIGKKLIIAKYDENSKKIISEVENSETVAANFLPQKGKFLCEKE